MNLPLGVEYYEAPANRWEGRVVLRWTLWLCLLVVCAATQGCGGEESEPAAVKKPTSVVAADLDKNGDYWNTLTPDLKDELVTQGQSRLGDERPDGADDIRAIDTDELVAEIDKQYSNEAKRRASIYETYTGANDQLARERLEELIPQLQDEAP